jgi:hypothetical protein
MTSSRRDSDLMDAILRSQSPQAKGICKLLRLTLARVSTCSELKASKDADASTAGSRRRPGSQLGLQGVVHALKRDPTHLGEGPEIIGPRR